MFFALAVRLLVAAPALENADGSEVVPLEEAVNVQAKAGPPQPLTLELEWYGWQILLSDAVSFLAKGVTGGVSLPGLVIAAPIVHAMHQRWPMALLSFGMRLVAPTLLVMYLQAHGLFGPSDPALGWGIVAVGCLVFLLDAFGLSWQPVDRAGAGFARVDLRLTPVAGTMRGLPFAGVAGTF